MVRIMPAMPGSVSVTGMSVEEPPQQDGVDDEREVGDQAEEAVVQQHVQEHDAEADEAGDEALVERVLAQRGGDLLLVRGLELDGQGAGVEYEGEVLGLLHGHVAAADLGAAADAVAQRRVGVVDHRGPTP